MKATYKPRIPILTDAMHMLLDHTLLGHVGGGKWPGDEAKPCHVLKSVLTVALYTCFGIT